MTLTAKERERRSKRRQSLNVELNIWLQHEKDMEVAAALKTEDLPEKLAFIRHEQAKLREVLSALDKGFRKQRAWSQGKLLY
jgi:hypothetical protein